MKNIIEILQNMIKVSNDYFRYLDLLHQTESEENDIVIEYQKELEALGNELADILHDQNNLDIIRNQDVANSLSRIADLMSNLRKNPKLEKRDVSDLKIQDTIEELENLGDKS